MATLVRLGSYSFSFQQLSRVSFGEMAAIYAVLDIAPGGSWTVLDIGQSGQVGSRIDSHDRRMCWVSNARYPGNIWVGLYRTPTDFVSKERRLQIERELRVLLRPKCGCR